MHPIKDLIKDLTRMWSLPVFSYKENFLSFNFHKSLYWRTKRQHLNDPVLLFANSDPAEVTDN